MAKQTVAHRKQSTTRVEADSLLHSIGAAICVLLLAGCGSEAPEPENTPLHIVEIPAPVHAAQAYEGKLVELVNGHIRHDERTVVIIADQRDGYQIDFPASMGWMERQSAYDRLEHRTEQAAALSSTSDGYRAKLHDVIREATEQEYATINHSVIGIGGLSALYGGTSQLDTLLEDFQKKVGPIQPHPMVDPPFAWGTFLGSWLFWISVLSAVFAVGYAWHYLGRIADEEAK